MSHQLREAVWQSRVLRGAMKAILVRLADRADKNGDAFAGCRSLAADVGVSRQTATVAVEQLIERGHLVVMAPAIGTRPRTLRVMDPTPSGQVALPQRGQVGWPQGGPADDPLRPSRGDLAAKLGAASGQVNGVQRPSSLAQILESDLESKENQDPAAQKPPLSSSASEKTTDEENTTETRTENFVCVDCDWSGTTSWKATQHYRQARHTIRRIEPEAQMRYTDKLAQSGRA